MSSALGPSSLYSNKVILAPMVRCGTLPFRLLCLRYGAELVYTEEIIDRKLLTTRRVVNDAMGTIDFITPEGAPALRTCAEERDRVVLQIGCADEERAVACARLVQDDVAGIDINCGCPKHFSIVNGMGAALLTPEKRDTLCAMVRSIRSVVPPPFGVSCKIRILDSIESTAELMQRLERAGASAIGVHMRQRHDSPKGPARKDWLRPLVDAVHIPVIANGDIWKREDITDIRARSGCSSVFLARGCLADPSLFGAREATPTIPLEDAAREYVRVATRVGNHHVNTKYTVARMFSEAKRLAGDTGTAIQRAKTAAELGHALGIGEEIERLSIANGMDPHMTRQKEKQRKRAQGKETEEKDDEGGSASKRTREEWGPETATMHSYSDAYIERLAEESCEGPKH